MHKPANPIVTSTTVDVVVEPPTPTSASFAVIERKVSSHHRKRWGAEHFVSALPAFVMVPIFRSAVSV